MGSAQYIIAGPPLLSGVYFFTAAIYDHLGVHAYDHHHMRYQFAVVPGGTHERYGMIYMPSAWEHAPGKSA